jgi:hypothetical protein
MISVGTPRQGAAQNYCNVMFKSSWVSNEAGNKEGIVNNLQESIINDKDFSGIIGGICPG